MRAWPRGLEMKLYHSSVRTQCSGRPAVEGFFLSSISTVACTIAEWFVNRAQSASPYQGQVPSVATSPATPAWIATRPPPRSMKFLNADCCSSFKMSPEGLRKITTLYLARFAAVNQLASSVASTWKRFSAPSCLIAVMPLVIEGCRNMSVFEKTKALKSAAGDRLCAKVAAVRARRIATNKKIGLKFVMPEAWRACDATQGLFHSNPAVVPKTHRRGQPAT